MGFSQGLNGRIVSKTVKPHHFSIPAKPGHLTLGILRGSGSRFRDGLLNRQLVIENRLRLPVANRLHRLGLWAVAGCAQAIEETTIRTAQYAKRQMTWFRRDSDIVWLDGFGDDPAVQALAESQLTQFLGIPKDIFHS